MILYVDDRQSVCLEMLQSSDDYYYLYYFGAGRRYRTQQKAAATSKSFFYRLDFLCINIIAGTECMRKNRNFSQMAMGKIYEIQLMNNPNVIGQLLRIH